VAPGSQRRALLAIEKSDPTLIKYPFELTWREGIALVAIEHKEKLLKLNRKRRLFTTG
jgi:hypothetical protein